MADLPLDALQPRLLEWRNRLHQPWLVAAWPGMGAVAQVAAHYLWTRLGAHELGELPIEDCFDLRAVEVEHGLIRPQPAPQNTLLAWPAPSGERDLVFFEGSAQPEHDAQRCCEAIVVAARALGVVRVCTFAAMATMIRPEARPHVFAVASEAPLLDEARRSEAEPLANGSIGGLNGLLVAVAARRGLPGLCLLGEMPYFASSIANPKACAAVLRTFCRLAKLSIDLTELDAAAVAVERSLVERLKQAERAAVTPALPSPPELREPLTEAELRERAGRVHVEELFAAAQRDRSKAPQLKAELDRLGLFKDYEDRFLDLFRRGE